jgi:ABC-type uncharacterized transport system substrate-binding protein
MAMEIGRRQMIAGLGGTVIAWPLAAIAQISPKRPLIAWLSGGTRTASMDFANSFLQGMRDAGYVEGRNFDIMYFFSEGFQERLPVFAEEIVRLKPDVILATAVVTAVAVRNATATIPIVCPALADAVHLGLIASESRPGGNITGIEPYIPGLPAKQIELVREMVPTASRVGLLTDLKDPKAPPQVQEQEAAGRAMRLTIVTAGANGPDDLGDALQALTNQHVDVVIVHQSSMLLSQRRLIAELALARRIPTVCGYREHVVDGGLVSYGVDLRWCFHRGAYFADKILKGAKPSDLPVEFPTKMVLSVNLKTASALGITVPPTLLWRADDVVE